MSESKINRKLQDDRIQATEGKHLQHCLVMLFDQVHPCDLSADVLDLT